MGATTFLIPDLQKVTESVAQRAYMAGMDQIPWRSRNLLDEKSLTILRDSDESGHLVIPWNVAGHGERMLRTASLAEDQPPYVLPVELARGMLSSLTNYLASWEVTGNRLSQDVATAVAEAKRFFSDAALTGRESERAAESAEKSLRRTCDAIRLFSADVVTRMTGRIDRTKPLLAANFGKCNFDEQHWAAFTDVFNVAMITVPWKEVEKDEGKTVLTKTEQRIDLCRNRGISIGLGPLVNLDVDSTPNWLYLWEDEFDRVSGYVQQHVHRVVEKLHPKVQLWHCHAGMNTASGISLTEEQRLRLTLQSLESLRSVDNRTPVVVSFDQPWGEYLHDCSMELTPLHYADAIVRSEISISAIGLQLNLGYWPHGSPRRDLLQLSQLIERWALFGVPLMVTLTAPACSGPDPNAGLNVSITPDSDDGCDGASQDRTIREIISLLLLKPAVQIICWDQLLDSQPHRFPHAGLFDADENARPLLETFRSLRPQFRD